MLTSNFALLKSDKQKLCSSVVSWYLIPSGKGYLRDKRANEFLQIWCWGSRSSRWRWKETTGGMVFTGTKSSSSLANKNMDSSIYASWSVNTEAQIFPTSPLPVTFRHSLCFITRKYLNRTRSRLGARSSRSFYESRVQLIWDLWENSISKFEPFKLNRRTPFMGKWNLAVRVGYSPRIYDSQR